MQLSKYKQKCNYLLTRKKNYAGRNNTGRITVAHQGGGHSQLYRHIDFKGNFSKGFVSHFEYDPNRSAYLAKICTLNDKKKKFFYILAPQNLKILDVIENVSQFQISENNILPKQVGNCYLIDHLRVGDFIYNIEVFPNKGAQLVRAGGTSAVILQKTSETILIKMPSGEHRAIPKNCKVFLGNLANEDHNKLIWKKAGKSRWLNIRPTVRGVAKNPIDHPHGGNTSGGCHPVTPWSRLTKGKPTRKKKYSHYIIKSTKNKL